jgi:hypothetical protein
MYGETLTTRERSILSVWMLKSTRRPAWLAEQEVGEPEIEELLESGYLKRSRNGALYLAHHGRLLLGTRMKVGLCELRQVMNQYSEPIAPDKPCRNVIELRPAAWARMATRGGRPLPAVEDEPGVSAFGVPFLGPTPAPLQGIGADCAAWRKRIAKGLPLFVRRKPARQASTAETLRPVDTCWKRVEVEYMQLDPSKPMNIYSYRWERDHLAQTRAPTRVRCPSCEHPIRLSRWWSHGCCKAVTTTGPALGDFAKFTDGAAAPEYAERNGEGHE